MLLELRTRHGWMAMVVDEFGTILGLLRWKISWSSWSAKFTMNLTSWRSPLLSARGADAAMIFDASLTCTIWNRNTTSFCRKIGFLRDGGRLRLSPAWFHSERGEADFDGCRFTVVEMDRRRVARVNPALKAPATGVSSRG